MDIDIKGAVEKAVNDINRQVQSRSMRAANELRDSALNVLRGERSGIKYRKPYTKNVTYRASAPGEPPANRSDTLRRSWMPRNTTERIGKDTANKAAISTDVKYAPWLNDGTKDGRIAPRPFKEPIIEKAKPRIRRIFKETYF
ncbi:MAG: hypothetical protein PHE09_08050 [Oscillospiraceae bacterium]|nr:hypothetical protein [Oscillospiraceae bacterium]